VADLIVLILGGLAGFFALSWLAQEYGRRTGWQTPEGSEASDWALRHQLALALGAAAMGVCAVVCAQVIETWPARALFMAQAALMAAAGASDLRKFHLPLPLSLAGIALGIVMAAVIQPPLFVVLFGLLWAVAVIALHMLASKGSMQLGDHLATLWIALVMPLNGMIAILAGDLANVILARVKGLRGRRIAAAGPWLLIAAALLALPPYFAWLQPPAPPASQVPIAPPAASAPASRDALLLTLDLAGDQTARVALAADRAGRVAQARVAAGHVQTLAGYARKAGADAPTLDALDALADALARYDVAAVRAATAQIAQQHAALSRMSEPPIIADTSRPIQ
jgi:hypothetical protein